MSSSLYEFTAALGLLVDGDQDRGDLDETIQEPG